MKFISPSDSNFKRHYREETAMVFSGIDCLLHGGPVIYCSSELTTGAVLYAALREHGVHTRVELKRKLGAAWFSANIWDRNSAAAREFAAAVRARAEGSTLVITPAPFSAPGWTQPEYLAFWETLLRTRVTSVWFNRNWEYSNGCTFEYAVALDAGLATFDRDGAPLGREAAASRVQAAAEALDADGFDAATLRENLDRIRGHE